MNEWTVGSAVCDWGVFKNGELKLITNLRVTAEKIVKLLEEDEQMHGELNPVKDYPPYSDRPKGRCRQ